MSLITFASLLFCRKSRTLPSVTWSSCVRPSTWSSCRPSNSKSAVTSCSSYKSGLGKKLSYAIWSLSVARRIGHTCLSMATLGNDSVTYSKCTRRSSWSSLTTNMRACIDLSRGSWETWLASLHTWCTQIRSLGSVCSLSHWQRMRRRRAAEFSSRFSSKRLQPTWD